FQPLHGHNTLSISPHGKIDTTVYRLTVYKYGACAALAHLAAFFHTGKPQPLPECIKERLPLIHGQFLLFSVHFHPYQFQHVLSSVPSLLLSGTGSASASFSSVPYRISAG